MKRLLPAVEAPKGRPRNVCTPCWITPRSFPEDVSTTGVAYFAVTSPPQAAVGIKLPNQLPANAAPPPTSEDFKSARRPTLEFNMSLRFMAVPPLSLLGERSQPYLTGCANHTAVTLLVSSDGT